MNHTTTEPRSHEGAGQHAAAFLPRLRRRGRQDRAGVPAGRVRRARGALGRQSTRRPALRDDPLAPRPPHFAPRPKRVIHLFMAGAPSQLDLFDYKPELREATKASRSRRGRQGPAVRVHPARRRLMSAAVQVRATRPVRRRALGDAAAPGEGRRRASRSSSRCTPTSSTTRRRRSSSTPARRSPGRPSLGSWVSYGLGSESRDLPGFVVMSIGRGHQRRRGQLVERLPADRLTRACRSATRATRSSTSPARRASIARLQRDSLDLIGDAQPAAPRRSSATPRSPRGSLATRWPSACRPSAPELMDLAQRDAGDARPLRRRAGQAVVRRATACWPGGWSSAACGSSTSITKAGTPTPTWPATQDALRRRPTRPPPRWSSTSSSAGCSTTRW